MTTRAARTSGSAAPHDLELEAAVLGTALLYPEGHQAVATRLDPADFYKPSHGHIAAALRELWYGSQPADPVLVANELAGDGLLDAIGGSATLLELQRHSTGRHIIDPGCSRLAELASARRSITAAHGLIEALTNGADTTHHLDQLAAALTTRTAHTELRPLDRLRARLLRGDAICNIPPPRPLIAGLLDLDSLAALYGPPAAGKSFLAIDWALSVATGSWWFGQAVEKGPVLYVVAEGASGVGPRVAAWQHARRTYSTGDIHWLTEAVNLTQPAWVDAAVTIVEDLQPRLVVIDTLARSMAGADENSAKDMGLVIDAAERIKRAAGCCVLLVHHTGKAKDAGLRGSSALLGAVDTALEVRTAEGIITLVDEKQKNHATGIPRRYRLDRIGLDGDQESAVIANYRGTADDELPAQAVETLRSLHQIDIGTGVSTSNWSDAAEASSSSFFRHRKGLLERNLVENLGTERQPRWTLTDLGRAYLDPDHPINNDEEF